MRIEGYTLWIIFLVALEFMISSRASKNSCRALSICQRKGRLDASNDSPICARFELSLGYPTHKPKHGAAKSPRLAIVRHFCRDSPHFSHTGENVPKHVAVLEGRMWKQKTKTKQWFMHSLWKYSYNSRESLFLTKTSGVEEIVDEAGTIWAIGLCINQRIFKWCELHYGAALHLFLGGDDEIYDIFYERNAMAVSNKIGTRENCHDSSLFQQAYNLHNLIIEFFISFVWGSASI